MNVDPDPIVCYDEGRPRPKSVMMKVDPDPIVCYDEGQIVPVLNDMAGPQTTLQSSCD